MSHPSLVGAAGKRYCRAIKCRSIITLQPGKRSGRPCIRHMRIAVAELLGWLASGRTPQQIIADFPELAEDDIRAALAYAVDGELRLVTPAPD